MNFKILFYRPRYTSRNF